jgi:competence protein ComEC
MPACAAVFWAGLLLSEGVPAPVGGGLLAVAVVAGVARQVSRWGRGNRSRALLSGAGLGAGAGEAPEPRERVLLAAGLSVGEPPPVPPSPRATAITLLLVLLAGLGWGALHMAGRPLGPIEGRYGAFSGTAASDVRRYDWGWGIEANLESIVLDDRTWPIEIRAWISASDDPLDAQAGQQLRGEGRLEALGGEGFEEYLASRGIEVSIHASDVRRGEGGVSLPLAAANASRRALRLGAERALDARPAGLLLGLAIGDTTGMDPEVEEDFRASGLGHLLAVSGSNVATFLAPVLLLASKLRTRPVVRAAVGFLALGFFALLTRWEPSVLRASAMATIALVALASGRPRSPAPAFGAAVLTLLVLDPRLSRSVGFELSVAATAGIAAMAGPIAARLRALPKPLALAVSATLAAQAAVTPLLLLRFGVVPTGTLLANVLAFPAVAPALLLGVPAAVLGVLWPAAGRVLGGLATIPLDYLMAVADRTGRFPLPSMTSEGALLPLVVSLLVLLTIWRLRRGRRPVVGAVVAVVLTAAAWAMPLSEGERSLTVTFLDVGQGDAAVVRSPGGATVLIDAGPEEDQVATDLARLGVTRIDLAVASHAHADHVAGFPAILARFPVSLLMDPGCPGDSPIHARFLRSVRDEEVRVEHPRGGDRFAVGDLSVEVLGPDECSSMSEPNDDSIVLRISLGQDSILFPGDAEVPAQQDMLDDRDPIEADILKVPHHGGDTSDPAFLEATGAMVAVLSTGENTYGHPHPAVIEVLRGAGMAIYRTDRAGDVTMRFTPDGAVVVGSRP